MAVLISNVNPQIDTFAGWVDRSNQAFYVISTYAVTTLLTPEGGLTTGNAYVNGIFMSNELATNNLRGGTVNASANLVVSSNLTSNGSLSTFNSNTLFRGSNVFFVTPQVSVTNGQFYINSISIFDSNVTLNANTVANTAHVKDLFANNFNANTSTFNLESTFNGNTTFNANVTLNANTVANNLTTTFANVNTLVANNGTFNGNTTFNANVTLNANTVANNLTTTFANVNTLVANNGTFLANVTFSENVQINGSLNVSGNLVFNQTSFADIIPDQTGYALGSSDYRWDLFARTGNFSNTLYISGNTTVNNTLLIQNQVIFNHSVSGSPTANAFIQVNRGSSANVFIGWDEVSDIWVAGSIPGSTHRIVMNDNGTYNINITGSVNTSNNATYLNGQLPSFYLNWNNFNNIPSTFTPAAHTQAISTITGLQTALDGKINVGDSISNALNANNATNLNGQAASYYLNAGNLTGTVAAARLSGTYNITANNATNLNGQAASYYLNAGNLTGTVAAARLSGTYDINITGTVAGANNATNLNGQAASYYLDATNLTGIIPSARLSGTYDINITGTVAGANNATNLNGQPGSYYSNAANLTGTVAAARLSGTYNITANNATNLNGQAASYYLDATNLTGTLPSARLSGTYNITANNATNLNGQPGSYYSNASNMSTGTLPSARLSGTYNITANNALTANNTTYFNGQAGDYYLARANHTGTQAISTITGLQTALDGKQDSGAYALQSITISAGNGMSGGGTIAANRTLSLGTPSTITGNTLNTSSGNTHTHALSANLSAWDTIIPAAKANITGATFTGPIATQNYVTINAGASGNEGGEVVLKGSASHPEVSIDNFSGTFRVFGSGVVNLSSNTTVFRVSGPISASGDISSFDTSDSNLKDNVCRITNGLDVISSLKGYTFNWNNLAGNIGKEGSDWGILAQELEAVAPDLVGTSEYGYKHIKGGYTRLIPYLIESIITLKQEIEDIKQKG